MNKGSNIEAFKEVMSQRMNKAVPMILRRVQVKSVNWDEKTMTATDLIDGLDHLDIRLGMGSLLMRPTVGTLALIAIIGKEEVDTVLIDCESIDQVLITDQTGFKLDLNEGKLALNGDAFSGIVKAPELKTQIDKNTAILQAIQQALSSWTPVPNDGGAAFKTAAASVLTMQRADLSAIENENITHG